MKVIILPENIINYLPLINKILPSHPQVPILANVLLEAKASGFYIKATDLEKGTQVAIPAKIEKEGSITVPGREFLETINSLPKDSITISVDKEAVIVSCREHKITFNSIPSEEFPQLFKEKAEEVARFGKKEFLEIFSCLTFSASQEETRPQLTGVYIDSRDSKVNFVSTDGYRMSIKAVVGQKKIKEGLIIAVELINEVMALKDESEIVLYSNKAESQIVFEVGDALIVGRMIEGQFPDYERVLPQEAKTEVVFDREEFLRNIRLASVFAKDNSNIVNLEVNGQLIKLSTRSQGVGEGEIVVEGEKTGEDNRIAFNIKYVLDLAKTLTDKNITLKLNSSTEPALFEVKDKDFLHVIMPIQVE